MASSWLHRFSYHFRSMGNLFSKKNRERFEFNDDFLEVYSYRSPENKIPFLLHKELLDEGNVKEVKLYSTIISTDRKFYSALKKSDPAALVFLETDIDVFVSVQKRGSTFCIHESTENWITSVPFQLVYEDTSRSMTFSRFISNIKQVASSYRIDSDHTVEDYQFALEIFEETALHQFDFSTQYFKVTSGESLRSVFGSSYEQILADTKITLIAAYKTPLEDHYIDPHIETRAFLVLCTNKGFSLSFEKMSDGKNVVGKSPLFECLVSGPSNRLVELVCKQNTSFPLHQFLDFFNSLNMVDIRDAQVSFTLHNRFVKTLFDMVKCRDKLVIFNRRERNPALWLRIFGIMNYSELAQAKVTSVVVCQMFVGHVQIKPNVENKDVAKSTINLSTHIVLKTDRGLYLSVEDKDDEITIRTSPWFEHLLKDLTGQEKEIKVIKTETLSFNLCDVLRFLEDCDEKSSPISKEIFDLLISNHGSSDYFKLTSEESVEERIFGANYRGLCSTVTVTHVTVYRTKLQEEDSSTFLVVRTSAGVLVSIRYLPDGIYLGTCLWLQSLLTQSSASTTQTFLKDVSNYSFSELLILLRTLDCENFKLREQSFKCNYVTRRVFEKLSLNQHQSTFKLNSTDDLVDVLPDATTLRHVAIYSTTPKNTISRSNSIKRSLGRNIIENTDKDQSVTLLLRTDTGVCFSLQNKSGEIYFTFNPWYRFKMFGDSQGPPSLVELVIEDESAYSLQEFLLFLKKQQASSSNTNLLFANLVFDEVSLKMNSVHFKLSFAENVEEKLLGPSYLEILKDKPVISNVQVFKTPLEKLYKSSHSRIRGSLAKQWTPVDYHAFLVITTNKGMYISLEKQQDGIYISRSPLYESLVYGIHSSPRNCPVELVIEDESEYPLSELLENLKREEDIYNPAKNNCQHFVKRHFDKVASKKHWEFERPTEYVYKLILQVFCLGLVLCRLPYVHLYKSICSAPYTLLGYLELALSRLTPPYWVTLIFKLMFFLLNIFLFFVIVLH